MPEYSEPSGVAIAVAFHVNGGLSAGENEDIVRRVEGYIPEAVVESICVVYITTFADGAVAKIETVFFSVQLRNCCVICSMTFLIGLQTADTGKQVFADQPDAAARIGRQGRPALRDDDAVVIIDLCVVDGICQPVVSVDAKDPRAELAGREVFFAIYDAVCDFQMAFSAGNDGT